MFLWPGIVALLVILVDQTSKIWAVQVLEGIPSVEVLGRFLMFSLVFNEGGAMGTSFGSSTYYLISSLSITLFLLYYIYVNRSYPRIVWPLALIAGGAVGNIIDRIRLGRVIDFIDVDFFNVSLFGFDLDRWWTFNVADAVISCSITYLVLSLLIFRRSTSSGICSDDVEERADIQA